MCIRNGAIRRVIDRERDEAATSRRNNNDDKSKQAMAFMYEKSHANGQQVMPSGPVQITASASAAFPQSASAARGRLIYVNA